MPWFYAITVALPVCVAVLVATTGQWVGALGLSAIAAAFAFAGWPLRARRLPCGGVQFVGLVRRPVLRSGDLTRVKAVGGRDYRRHVTLRSRNGLPVGYRLTRFTGPDILAGAVLRVVEGSGARVDDEALALLREAAGQCKGTS